MGDDVSVAVARQPRAFDLHAAQHEPAGRIVGEGVHVEADPHAHRRHGQKRYVPPTMARATSRSRWVVIFALAGSPGTTMTRPPAASTSPASSLASAPPSCAPRNAPALKACGV